MSIMVLFAWYDLFCPKINLQISAWSPVLYTDSYAWVSLQVDRADQACSVFFGQESCSVAVCPSFPRTLSEVRPERGREAARRGGERVNCDGKANGSQHGGATAAAAASSGSVSPRRIKLASVSTYLVLFQIVR